MASNGFQNTSYNDRPPSSTGSGEADVASDPASGGFFLNDYKKHEDLKIMLDGNKDNLKLEAMKRIIGMVAKGKDASDLFPAVVKNVVSKNIEVKKLVYVYLTRYAEEQQDLALLSISTFQRALKDPNQLIRASALRVLSSIRVPMIVPIMMLAIKDSVNDMSPYVRKTAAHAIPKLHSLDDEQKDSLVEVIEKLLADKTTLVAGSAIQAFEEVCPERIDLIHKNYRKLCNLLVDVEEWGQVVIINLLTRYARLQFINPNKYEMEDDENKPFYESEASNKASSDDESDKPKKPVYVMDADHRLLLRTCKPLLNSRNGSVVMAVAQLYHHCAPKGEVGLVAKALVRLLRSNKEVQYVVLSNIATMSLKRKGMFEPLLKSFYVRSNDPTHVKLLKLEILTNLATETSISTILREFQTYVTSSDKEFAAATIQAIGRCASSIAEVTDTCLNGLVSLMSNRDESVVGESVVVIKKLLQMKPSEYKDIIVHLAKMVDEISVPMARASILWLIGEYSDRVPKIAPDVLRKLAKSFISEEDIVKLQVLNLAAKLCITNSKQTKLLCQYVFNLAKYDLNYDIRDRARFLRQLIIPNEKSGALAKHAKKIFLSSKPAPVLESKFKDRDVYQLGTLSHVLNVRATGYQEIPDWPDVAPDPSVRNVEVEIPWKDNLLGTRDSKKGKKKEKKERGFYSESESSEEEESTTSGSSESSEDSSEDSSQSEEEEEEESESEEETESDDSSGVEDIAVSLKPKAVAVPVKAGVNHKATQSESGSSSESSSSSSEESSSEEEVVVKKPTKKEASKSKTSTKKASNKQAAAMLLDLDDFGPAANNNKTNGNNKTNSTMDLLTPSLSSDLSNMSISGSTPVSMVSSPIQVQRVQHDLLNRITGNGLGISYAFTRTVSVFSPKLVSIELTFNNTSENELKGIKIGEKKLQSGMEMQDFPEITSLGKNTSTSAILGVNFCDTTQPAKFEIIASEKAYNVSINAPVGELLQPFTMNEKEFITQQGKLAGMNENSGKTELPENKSDSQTINERILTVANVLQVPSTTDNTYRYVAKTMSESALLLVTIKVAEDRKATITVNCEKMVICSMLVKDIKQILSKK
ncbi:unnamed protein product [Owenia fusiformis]|uniref:AP-3 complex subunit beta n=1 Tax=Owenia fusiformis TaxID=6347 RepID=A0A8S4PU61_OWEFU|nr:unnamed protein product [Owenia fusiformis]